MRRFVVVAAAMIVLPASAARGDDSPVQTRVTNGASASAVPAVGASCLADRSARAWGRVVDVEPDSLTMSVEDGSGSARAFVGARLQLPVAPNATIAAGLRPGGRLSVLIVPCPDASGSAFTLVVGRVDLAPLPATKKPRKR